MRLLVFIALFAAQVSASNLDWSAKELEPLTTFFTKENISELQWPNLVYVQEADLPDMQRSILSQPLLTAAITDYYQRTPKIREPLHIDEDLGQNQFYRAIIMIVDKNRQRDNALLADTLNESRVVELGLISINFSALPEMMKNDIRQGQTPFGALLMQYKIATQSIDTRYFKMTCESHLAHYLQCEIGDTVYGRSNTIIRQDNALWLAKTVEILAGRHLEH